MYCVCECNRGGIVVMGKGATGDAGKNLFKAANV